MNKREVKEKSSVPIGVLRGIKGFYVQPSRVFPAGQTEECFKFICLRFYIFFPSLFSTKQVLGNRHRAWGCAHTPLIQLITKINSFSEFPLFFWSFSPGGSVSLLFCWQHCLHRAPYTLRCRTSPVHLWTSPERHGAWHHEKRPHPALAQLFFGLPYEACNKGNNITPKCLEKYVLLFFLVQPCSLTWLESSMECYARWSELWVRCEARAHVVCLPLRTAVRETPCWRRLWMWRGTLDLGGGGAHSQCITHTHVGIRVSALPWQRLQVTHSPVFPQVLGFSLRSDFSLDLYLESTGLRRTWFKTEKRSERSRIPG